MSFFWPAHIDPDPSIFGRLGRVVHWTGMMFGVLLGVALGGMTAFLITGPYVAPAPLGPYLLGLFVVCALVAALVAAPFYFVGRGVRYFLAGE